MVIVTTGHTYKYACEQILLTLFPSERPVFAETLPESGDWTDCRLHRGRQLTTAHTVMHIGGKKADGYSRVSNDLLTDELRCDSLLQKAIKLSFFRAAQKHGIQAPPWGVITGVRPTKIAAKLLSVPGTRKADVFKTFIGEYSVSPERAGLCIDTAEAELAIKSSLKKNDISLYVGIPFCPTRCAYCSFVSHSVEKTAKLIAPFLETLHREIEALGPVVSALGLNVASVYVGGGTPTTLSAEELADMIAALRRSFDLSTVREFTVEAGRPDTITAEKLSALKAGGVTRISVNPQTMRDSVLETIGRCHSAAQTEAAFSLASDYHFDCINADLIAGLPGDDAGGFRYSLDSVLSFAPGNITIHNLSRKRGAALSSMNAALPSDEAIAEMFDYSLFRLRGEEYIPYYLYRQKFMAGGFENTGWAKPGLENIYNVCMMEELHSVLSLGGGGVTKLVSPDTGKIERIFNPKYPYEYVRDIDSILEKKSQIIQFFNPEGG